VQFEFVILDWAAYADSLTTRQDWLEWASHDPVPPATQVAHVPALSEMPAMMRRRVDRLGRLACQVAYWCQPSAGSGPLVFASRYGDAHRSLALLGDLVAQQQLSPAGFALSVHNAVAALYSIARGDLQHAVVVAAGQGTVRAALTEAVGLLTDGAQEVLVVFYEAPLPATYAYFEDERACEYAWALRLAGVDRAGEGTRVRVRIDAGEAPGQEGTFTVPAGLRAFHGVLAQLKVPVPGSGHA
jgi:hypothetical protein